MQIQAPSSVVMIRPHAFRSNPETQVDNAFQTAADGTSVAAQARAEFDAAVAELRTAGILVHDFDDTGSDTPDSVFPNNWVSTHAGGHVAVYPMFAENRRRERRWDVIDMLKRTYRVQDVIDYSGLEQDGLALEGTGAMVLDHVGRVAYVARSKRADPVLLERFCTHFNYEPIAFDATDTKGQAVYHTNVLMCIATHFALVGLEMITDPARRRMVADRLTETGHDVIALSSDQIAEFAGNAIELTGSNGAVLALSQRALASLTGDQITRITPHATLLPLSVPTLETAGGSVRCMIAGLHLAKR
jgi:hypothetical protein